MRSQSAIRRGISFLLVLPIVLWAETGLAMATASSHVAKCRASMLHGHQHTMNSAALATRLGCCRQRTHSMPCCPPHVVLPPTQCGDRSGCCGMGSQPAWPLAFLVVSGNPLSSQVNANGPAGAMLMPALSAPVFLAIGHSPPFVRPVFALKTDLRI